jgi:hypothetical protein
VASPVYSTRFNAWYNPGSGSGTSDYTVPSGKVAVIKCLNIVNFTTSAEGVTLQVQGDTGIEADVWTGAVPSFSTVIEPMMVVCNAGEVIQVQFGAFTTGSVSGYLLSA